MIHPYVNIPIFQAITKKMCTQQLQTATVFPISMKILAFGQHANYILQFRNYSTKNFHLIQIKVIKIVENIRSMKMF